MPPRATYRIQFSRDFGFDDAARLAPYLARLGVSHLYASPYLKARPGSTHGYDIVDHDALNPELGDEAAFERMNAVLRANGLGQILDFVPNHMGVGGADNPIWLDVLEWGQASPYAGWFDIEWSPDRSYLQDKLLVPFLGEQFGAALEAGHFSLAFDAEAGSFAVWVYGTHKLPIAPAHYGRILGTTQADLERLGDAFANLSFWQPSERERAAALKCELAETVASNPEAARALAVSLAGYRGREGDLASWSALETLMRDQFWRPAYFRVAADDINYRRFFNIADLAGLRMELPAVFDHAHRLVFDLMRQGVVDGLRIDHIDGLLDPKAYLDRLRLKAPSPQSGAPFYLVVEKILAEDEQLREDWPIDGTTGYEAANLLLRLLIDPGGEAALTRTYSAFSGSREAFDDILRHCKKRIMDNEMASELAGLARAAGRVALQTSRTADFTRNILRRAIREIVASFPVYRTYVDFGGTPADTDRALIAAAIRDAKTHESAIDESVYAFMEALLTGDLVAQPNSGFSRSAVLRFATAVQQYSGPVTAKGLEDTAFYRYNRFIALNEVGGDPRLFGVSLADFHAANAERATRWPHAMLGTSTHDTKRGEDARARLAVLSELPGEWTEAVGQWSSSLRRGSASAPDRNDEYALFQTLVGTVPPALLTGDPGGRAWSDYALRVKAAMRKSLREAKVHTSWSAPNDAYESGMMAFIDDALSGDAGRSFRDGFVPFATRVARLGVQNSLVQTVLKLTMPGVPDLYRGTELWDLSMVDPDNRRPINFDEPARLLDALGEDGAGAIGWSALQEAWPDGRIKLALTATLLNLRRRMPSLFDSGSYQPLVAEGSGSDAICAFARRHQDSVLCVLAARFPVRREREPLGSDLRLAPPEGGGWRDVLRNDAPVEDLAPSSLLGDLPVAILVGKAGARPS